MTQHTVRHYAHPATYPGITYSIDTPREETIDFHDADFLPIRAWAFSSDGVPLQFIFSFSPDKPLPPNTERPDVNSLYSEADIVCGLCALIPFEASFDIGVLKGDVQIWLATIELTQVQVLEGSNGYLFLDNDDNESVDQYSGKRRIDPDNMAAWADYFHALNKRPDAHLSSFAFCIAPAKEYVFPELYPVFNSRMTPYDQFKETFSRMTTMIDPIKSLFQHKHLAYSKNDTHWTDFGAFITAQIICARLGIPFTPANLIYVPRVTTGDLGIKYNPQKLEYSFFVDFTHSGISRFDNTIPVRGNILTFNNPKASVDATCLIFGSSSSESVAIQLCGVFSRVVRVFSGADIDLDIIEHEKPSHIIVILASRFLVRAPTVDFSIRSEIQRKLECLTPHEAQDAITQTIKSISHGLDEHYLSMLESQPF